MTREESLRRIERAAKEKLITLDLSSLDLKGLPPEIVKCKHLTELYLDSNEITLGMEVIGQLSNLVLLSLYNNKLTSIPEAIG